MRVITNDKVKEIISFDPFWESNSSDLISIREQIENGKIIIYLLSNGSWGRTQLPMWAVKAEDSEKASCS